VPATNVHPQHSPAAGRRQGAERWRLLRAQERLRNRWYWAADAQDRATARADDLAAQLAETTAKLDALAAERPVRP
jgi:hypothetical protein